MLSPVRLSSVTFVHPTQAVEIFGNLSAPYDSPGTLVFWPQHSLVGDTPFPLKFALKVTNPPQEAQRLTKLGVVLWRNLLNCSKIFYAVKKFTFAISSPDEFFLVNVEVSHFL